MPPLLIGRGGLWGILHSMENPKTTGYSSARLIIPWIQPPSIYNAPLTPEPKKQRIMKEYAEYED